MSDEREGKVDYTTKALGEFIMGVIAVPVVIGIQMVLAYIWASLMHTALTHLHPYLPDGVPVWTQSQIFAVLIGIALIFLYWNRSTIDGMTNDNPEKKDKRPMLYRLFVWVFIRLMKWSAFSLAVIVAVWVLNNWY